jgi:hypothetical protein
VVQFEKLSKEKRLAATAQLPNDEHDSGASDRGEKQKENELQDRRKVYDEVFHHGIVVAHSSTFD